MQNLRFFFQCLAAGSNIVDREGESDAIRPLAKKLTRQLENLREILKDQSLKNPSVYTDKVFIINNLQGKFSFVHL